MASTVEDNLAIAHGAELEVVKGGAVSALPILLDALRAAHETHIRLVDIPRQQGKTDDIEGLQFIERNAWGDRALVVDYQAEEAILQHLRTKNFPAKIVSEEHGEFDLTPDPQFVVVMDGVDGSSMCLETKGLGRSATMLAIYSGTNPKYGDYLCAGIFEHSSGRLYYAARNQGAWLIEKGLKSAIKSNAKQEVDRNSVIYVDKYWDAVKSSFINPLSRQNIPWSCLKVVAAHYVDVACGMADFNLECTRKRNLEIAISYGLIREAGGTIVDSFGRDLEQRKYFEFGWNPNEHLPVICAANPELAQALVKLLGKDLIGWQLLDGSRDEILNALHHLQGTYSSAELKMLTEWRDRLNPIKWGGFLTSWARALGAYGTPLEYLSDVKFTEHSFEINSKSYRSIGIEGGVYPHRRQLMKTQAHYVPARQLYSYGYDLKLESCFLCQNVAQAIDAQDEGRSDIDCAVLDLGDWLVLPNRYPAFAGHSLWVPKNHDAKRGTTGRVLQRNELLQLVKLCDKLDLVANRNHVLDGMSLPQHDHFHLLPRELVPSNIVFDIIGKANIAKSAENIFIAEGSPFENLVVAAPTPERRVELLQPIVERLENAGEVFCVAYYPGYFLISPRIKERQQGKFIQIGSGVQLHFFNPNDQTLMDTICTYIPLKGQFDWRPYVDVS